MKTHALMLIATALTIASCSKTSLKELQPSLTSDSKVLDAGNVNGRGGARSVYYDAKLVTVNMVELSASEVLIANNKSINKIYASNDLDDPQDFNSVITAIPTDGFNPLWQQFLIVFNAGFTPHQFFSDVEVEVKRTL